jgi:hypothetical protein
MAKKPMLPFLSVFNSSVTMQLEEMIHDIETMKGQLEDMGAENPRMKHVMQPIEYSLIGIAHDLRALQERLENQTPNSQK